MKVSGTELCPAFGKCGGCQYLHKTYETQLQRKTAMIKELFQDHDVEETLGMEAPMHYRHKVQVTVGKQKGKIVTGNYQAGTRKLVPVESCLLEDEGADAIIADIRRIADRFHMYAYDQETRQGFLRYIQIRKGYATGEYMVVIVTNGFQFEGRNNFKKELLKKHPEITTMVQNINTRTDGMILADKQDVFYGPGFIYDEMLGKRFRISANSFYQVNPAQTEKLYETALSMTDLSGKSVMDAYCGTGTIGILAADKARSVTGLEINPQAVKDAKVNAKLNHVDNITFIQGDAGEYLLGESIPDVVIMDPPRSGSTPEFLSAIANAKVPEVIYVSCGPETQARDVKMMEMMGYEVKKIQPVDLFPFTDHVENVILLSRNT